MTKMVPRERRRWLAGGFAMGLIVALGTFGIGGSDPPGPGFLLHDVPWSGWAIAGLGYLAYGFVWWRLR